MQVNDIFPTERADKNLSFKPPDWMVWLMTQLMVVTQYFLYPSKTLSHLRAFQHLNTLDVSPESSWCWGALVSEIFFSDWPKPAIKLVNRYLSLTTFGSISILEWPLDVFFKLHIANHKLGIRSSLKSSIFTIDSLSYSGKSLNNQKKNSKCHDIVLGIVRCKS